MYVKHKKTGGIYRVMALAIREADLEPLTVYVSEETGMIWSRPAKEFWDGRYEVYIPKPFDTAPQTGGYMQ